MKNKITVTSFEGDYSKVYTFFVSTSTFSTRFTVSAFKARGKWESPTINWPGCGNHTTANTKVFSEALALAISLAESLDSGNTEKVKGIVHYYSPCLEELTKS
jgi:hypothetical protein